MVMTRNSRRLWLAAKPPPCPSLTYGAGSLVPPTCVWVVLRSNKICMVTNCELAGGEQGEGMGMAG